MSRDVLIAVKQANMYATWGCGLASAQRPDEQPRNDFGYFSPDTDFLVTLVFAQKTETRVMGLWWRFALAISGVKFGCLSRALGKSGRFGCATAPHQA
jgi:hypothetical protein